MPARKVVSTFTPRRRKSIARRNLQGLRRRDRKSFETVPCRGSMRCREFGVALSRVREIARINPVEAHGDGEMAYYLRAIRTESSLRRPVWIGIRFKGSGSSSKAKLKSSGEN